MHACLCVCVCVRACVRVCVCVCVCVLNRRYGEMIARKVRDMGMRVEMVLLTPDVTLAGMLEDAVRRHLLYSVLVTEQHELHVSCTVHILEGRMQQGNFCFFIFYFLHSALNNASLHSWQILDVIRAHVAAR